MTDFKEIWDKSTLPVYDNIKDRDWKVAMYPRWRWWYFRDTKRFKRWILKKGLWVKYTQEGQGWNLLFGQIPWGYFHLAWYSPYRDRGRCYMEIRYDRRRNIFSRNIVDEIRAIPENICIEHGIPVRSMIGRFNKVKNGSRKFKCWFLMIEKGVINA